MIVMKFGGSSIADNNAITRVVEIIKNHIEMSPILIFSAMGKTTRNLLQAALHVENGDSKNALDILADIKHHYRECLDDLTNKNPSTETINNLETCFSELDNLFKGLAILKDLSPKSRDKILSFGELMTSIIMEQALSAAGLNVKLVDARDIIITNDSFGEATPIYPETTNAIKNNIVALVKSKIIPITQGFIGSTLNGHTTTLGFEGSDFTASIIGAAANVDEIQLWKTVPGIMTTDPLIDRSAIPIARLSYPEAATLTHLGASCIHAKAILPAKRCSIPIRMKNSENPADFGTIVSNDVETNGIPRSITRKNDLTLISIEKDGEAPGLQLSHSFYPILHKYNIGPLYLVSTENGISVLLPKSCADKIAPELNKLQNTTWTRKEKLSLVSIVGEKLTTNKKLSSIINSSLEQFSIYQIIEDPSLRSIGLIVNATDTYATILKLHTALFSNLQKDTTDHVTEDLENLSLSLG